MARYSIQRSSSHRQRYREIARVFIRYGFGYLFAYLDSERQPGGRSAPSSAEGSVSMSEPERAVHLRQALEELGPTFVKLGQTLSTRPDLLSPAYIAELSKLQDAVPPVPWEAIRQVITQELGRPPEEAFASIDTQPLAAASLGQVHAATLSGGEEVVIKVQRPNIVPGISTDLDILQDLAAAAESSPLLPKHDYVGIAKDFASSLRNELDYCREARNADRIRANFADEPCLYVPRVYGKYTTPRLLVLERIHGIKIDDVAALDAAGYDRHQVALNCARMIMKEVLEDGFFHADPHPGNLVVMPGEVIGAMDFGKVGNLSDKDRADLTHLFIAAMSQDADGIVGLLIHMGASNGQVDSKALSQDVYGILTEYQNRPIKEIHIGEVLDEVLPITDRYDLHMPSRLTATVNMLAMVEGVALTLDPDFDITGFCEPYVRQMSWRLLLPRRSWPYELLSHSADLGELLGDLPRTGKHLLERLERGEMLQMRFSADGSILSTLDRLTTRMALAVLIAALTISLALLMPLTTAGGPLQLPVTIGFGMTIGLTAWLIISILRGTR
jgi:ubiquinone biosynthesis protein